jgi:hypothetical protein
LVPPAMPTTPPRATLTQNYTSVYSLKSTSIRCGMKLPHGHVATVSRIKVLGYLLDDSHPRGRSKAMFFRRLGFDPAEPRFLEEELMRLARENEVLLSTETEFGVRYVIDGWVVSPTAAQAEIRTVWFVHPGEEIPRFVTAHPARRRR